MKPYQSTKHGRPIRGSRRASIGLHWLGRDDHGISIWEGTPGALRWGSAVLGFIGGTVFTIGAVVFAISGVIQPLAIMAPLGMVHMGLAWWMRRLHAKLSALMTVEEFAAAQGVAPEQLERWAEGEAKPQAIINRKLYFHPADLDDAARLLRASQPPAEDELLRPAAPAIVDDNLLLRTLDTEEPAIRSNVHENPPQNQQIGN